MGDYLKYTISAKSEDHSDLIISELAELGFDSFSQFDDAQNNFEAYVQMSLVDQSVASYMAQNELEYDVEVVEQQNWNELWESNFEPIEVGTLCYIRADFHPAKSEFEQEIVITPKMSFGTGHHPTTHLMVETMFGSNFEELSVLDMGSGTAILAILAAKLGAKSVDAVDIDEWAFTNGVENVQTNGVEDVVTPILGDDSVLEDGKKYDFILANINRNILLDHMHAYVEHLSEGGHLLMSGFLEIDCEALIECAEGLGLAHRGTALREGWAVMEFTKKRQLRLRAPQMDDLELLYKWENDPEVQAFGDEGQEEYSMDDLREFIERDDNLVIDGQQRLMIECEGQAVGCIDFYDFDIEARSAYVGILIYQSRGKGMGAEALRMFADYASSVYHLRSLLAIVPSENHAAQRLFQKLGFVKTQGDTYKKDL